MNKLLSTYTGKIYNVGDKVSEGFYACINCERKQENSNDFTPRFEKEKGEILEKCMFCGGEKFIKVSDDYKNH